MSLLSCEVYVRDSEEDVFKDGVIGRGLKTTWCLLDASGQPIEYRELLQRRKRFAGEDAHIFVRELRQLTH